MRTSLQLNSVMKTQKGAVLLTAMVILTVVTVLGVTTLKLTSDKTQTSGNSIYSMLVYQGAESTLARSATMYQLEKAEVVLAAATVDTYIIPASEITDVGEKINDKARLTSIAKIQSLGPATTCPYSNGAYSNTTPCLYYEISAQTQLKSTGARATHLEGRVIQK